MANAVQKIDTKHLLLHAAEELFIKESYAEVSTRAIAECAGVNLAAIKYHFGSKGNLFIECIRQMFTRQQQERPAFKHDTLPQNQEEAAFEIARFIESFLQDVSCADERTVCRLMYREMLGGTSTDPELSEALVSTFVHEFIRPMDERLQHALRLVQPALSASEAELVVHSIVGQCSFYLTNRAFFERLRATNFSNEETIQRVLEHVVRFTLNGLAVDAALIDKVLSGLKEEKL